jgi:hypothetical protein
LKGLLMSIKKTLFYYLLFALLLPAMTAFAAGKQPEFSATLMINEGGVKTDARMHYSKDKQRMEMQDESLGGKSVVITRLDRKLIWVLLPAQKMYMETPISQQKSNPLGLDPDSITKRERIGKETLDGHPCVKEKVTTKEADGSTESMYYWEATDLGWPIKAEAIDGSWSYTYKAIKTGRQDPSLFEVPKGYTKMDTSRLEMPEMPDMTEEPPEFPGPELLPQPEEPVPSAPDEPTPMPL